MIWIDLIKVIIDKFSSKKPPVFNCVCHYDKTNKNKLSEHFTINEFEYSEIALKNGIENKMREGHIQNARNLCYYLLEPIRSFYDKPIKILSGYRSLVLNQKVRGAKTSQHMKGQACDFIIEGTSIKTIYHDIIGGKIEKEGKNILQYVDQLILEPTWIHISWNLEPRKQYFVNKL